MNTKKIIIVDDDANFCKTLSNILRTKGYVATIAATGGEALDRIREEKPVVALIDLRLEDMSGLELMEKIKECSSDTECIVLTGYASQSSAIEAVNLGAYAYVKKPYDMEQLLLTIRRAIEKREAEKALQKSEKKYRALFESVPVGIGLATIDGKVLMCNNTMYQMTGYSRGELDQINLTGTYQNPEEHALLLKRLQKDGCVRDFEVKLKRKDGTTYYASLTITLLSLDGEDVVMTVKEDITDRKQAQEKLEESEEKFRTITEQSLMGICIAQDNKIQYINKTYADIFGYSVEEMLDWELEDAVKAIYPEDREMALEQLKKKQAGSQDIIIHYQYRGIRKTGETIWVDNYSKPIIYEGRPANLVTIIDITSRKEAEEELKIKDNAIESSVSAIVFSNLEGHLTYVNKSFLNMWGYDDEKEVLGKSDVEFWQVKEKAHQVVEVLRDKGSWIGELTAQRKDGSLFDVQLSTSIVFDKDSKPIRIMASFLDITDRKKLEEERQKVKNLSSIGVLAGGIAHDFNNLLTGIIGNISLAKLYSNQVKVRERLTEAERASMQAKDLTQQLLTFAKGGAPIKETADISEILKDTALFTLRGSNVRCDFSIPDDLWLVEVDKGQISQVIQNLVINANQAMPVGGVIRIIAENTIINDKDNLPACKEGKYIKISIEDEGIGIPKEYLTRIFDPYFSTKAKNSDRGTGLGLTICHSIIRRHNGYITVESEVGVGTTFYIYLPASQKDVIEETSVKELIFSGTGRILLMDDEKIVRDVAGEMLKYLGYDVEFAYDGSSAIELYKEAKESGKPFDVVILDLTVPGGMGGKKALEKLLQVDPKVTAIVSSGYSTDPIITNFKQYGFSGVVAKPYNIKELGEILLN